MPQAELQDWKRYAELEPFGSHYDDLRAGSIAAAVYNVNRDREKHPDPIGALELFEWNDSQRPSDEPEILDPVAQSDAIRRLLGFGR